MIYDVLETNQGKEGVQGLDARKPGHPGILHPACMKSEMRQPKGRESLIILVEGNVAASVEGDGLARCLMSFTWLVLERGTKLP